MCVGFVTADVVTTKIQFALAQISDVPHLVNGLALRYIPPILFKDYELSEEMLNSSFEQ